MKYAVIAAVGIAGTTIAAPVQPQKEPGQGKGQGPSQGNGNSESTSTVPAWETTTPAWETPTPAASWPTSMPWVVPGSSGYLGGGWPTEWPTGWPTGWATSSVSISPAATSSPILPICPDVEQPPNADTATIECVNLPKVPETNPGGPIEPLDGNTGPKRRSVFDWFKGNNNNNNKDN